MIHVDDLLVVRGRGYLHETFLPALKCASMIFQFNTSRSLVMS